MQRLHRIGGWTPLLYALSLAVAAGLLGLLVKQNLTQLGFVPTRASGTWVILGAASAYAVIELLFLALMRAYRPTHSPTTLVTEIVSNAAALIFIPYLLHVPLPWPNATLEKAETLLYIAAFGGIHAFLKLATFYASIEGAPASRKSAGAWTAGAALATALLILSFQNWQREAEAARSVASIRVQTYRAGYELAQGRIMNEGATLRTLAEPAQGQTLSLRVANLPDTLSSTRYEKIYVRMEMFGDTHTEYWTSLVLRDDGWSNFRVPSARVPAGLREYEVRWTRKAEPNWQAIVGLRPMVYNVPERPGAVPPPPANIILSGPSEYRERPPMRKPNVLLLVVDGLAANHLSILGYPREATPAIDQLGYDGAVFPNAYAPPGDSLATIRAFLGGQPQFQGTEHALPLVDLLREEHYATAAFIEEGNRDSHERFAAAFDLVNVHDPNMSSAEGPGSRLTLERARTWIDRHKDVAFLCLIRLREIEDVQSAERYGEEYNLDGELREIDLFDNALLYLDNQIGALLKHIRDRKLGSSTIIVLTSTYGHQFALGESGRRLSTRTDRIPLIIKSPGASVRRSPERAGPQDVAATLAELTGVSARATFEGRNLLR